MPNSQSDMKVYPTLGPNTILSTYELNAAQFYTKIIFNEESDDEEKQLKVLNRRPKYKAEEYPKSKLPEDTKPIIKRPKQETKNQ